MSKTTTDAPVLDFASMDPALLAQFVAQAAAHMSTADLASSQKEIAAAKKKAQDAEKARWAELGRSLVETVLAENPCRETATSTRVGTATSSLPIEVDGVKYTFYVSIKDVAATEAREKAVEAGTLVLEKPKRKGKSTQDEQPTDEASTDDDTTVVTLPTKPAA